jgi:hypothetical protein
MRLDNGPPDVRIWDVRQGDGTVKAAGPEGIGSGDRLDAVAGDEEHRGVVKHITDEYVDLVHRGVSAGISKEDGIRRVGAEGTEAIILKRLKIPLKDGPADTMRFLTNWIIECCHRQKLIGRKGPCLFTCALSMHKPYSFSAYSNRI